MVAIRAAKYEIVYVYLSSMIATEMDSDHSLISIILKATVCPFFQLVVIILVLVTILTLDVLLPVHEAHAGELLELTGEPLFRRLVGITLSHLSEHLHKICLFVNKKGIKKVK